MEADDELQAARRFAVRCSPRCSDVSRNGARPKAGLQSKAQHGIFHAPVFAEGESQPRVEDRQGYRVAITARITFEDSESRIQPYVENDHYSFALGPNGNKTLCLS